jgi:hypothetical protein
MYSTVSESHLFAVEKAHVNWIIRYFNARSNEIKPIKL